MDAARSAAPAGAVGVAVKQPGPAVGQLPLIETPSCSPLPRIGAVEVGKMRQQHLLTGEFASSRLLHRVEHLQIGRQRFVGVLMHRVHAVVVAGDQVLGSGSGGEPRQGALLASPASTGDVTEQPHHIGVGDLSIPTPGQLGVMPRGIILEAPQAGYEAVPNMQVSGEPNLCSRHRVSP